MQNRYHVSDIVARGSVECTYNTRINCPMDMYSYGYGFHIQYVNVVGRLCKRSNSTINVRETTN